MIEESSKEEEIILQLFEEGKPAALDLLFEVTLKYKLHYNILGDIYLLMHKLKMKLQGNGKNGRKE